MSARLAGLAAATASALALGAGGAWAAKDDTRLASLPTGADGSGNDGGSEAASLSADGRYVAFESTADNLAANDTDAFTNIYVRDLVAQTTTLASLPTGVDGSGNNASSFEPSISADGRYVAFESHSDNLSANDNDLVTNIYVRDMVGQTTTFVSLPTGTDGSGNNLDSENPSISADGRHVAFDSLSSNLAGNANGGVDNVYVRDLAEQTTTLVSLPTGVDGTGNNGFSDNSSISADGRLVAFESFSDNLATNDNDGVQNVYVRDLVGQSTTLASLPTGTDGSGNTDGSNDPFISPDGRYVAFESIANNLATNDNDTVQNVYVRDLIAQTTTLVSLPAGTDGSGNTASSGAGPVSAGGRHVAFDSFSSNLAANDTNGVQDVFVRDLVGETTTLASLPTGTDGSGNTAASNDASISADGRYVAFDSDSDNLAANDNDGVRNVYARTFLSDPPRNLEPPQLTGQPVVGQELTCSDGLWTEGALTRLWRRNEQPIGGATGGTYTPADGDAGEVIDCLVTATNADGSDSARSNAVIPFVPGQGPPGAAGSPGAAGPPGESAIRLLVGLISDRVRVRRGSAVSFRYLATAPGEVTLEIRRRGRVLASVTDEAEGGRNRLRWNGRRATRAAVTAERGGRKAQLRRTLRRGRYRIRLAIVGADGQSDTDRGRLRILKRR